MSQGPRAWFWSVALTALLIGELSADEKPSTKSTVSPQRTITPGLGVGGVIIGMSMESDVLKAFGKHPEQGKGRSRLEYTEVCNTRNRCITVDFDKYGFVESLTIGADGSDFALTNGVSTKSSLEDLKQFGDDFKESGKSRRYDRLGLEIRLSGDKVSDITVFQGTTSPSGKPTAAQTIAYLDERLNSVRKNRCTGGAAPGGGHYADTYYDDLHVSLHGERKMQISFSGTINGSNLRRENFSIDLRNVESIDVSGMGSPGGCHVMGLVFMEKGKSDRPFSLHLPLGIGAGDYKTLREDLMKDRVFKAFQHYRKLVKAPDPITFD